MMHSRSFGRSALTVMAGMALVMTAACAPVVVFAATLMFAIVMMIGCPDVTPISIDGAGLKHTVARPFESTYLGSAAHLSGAADTDWRSDVELHNASDEGATVTLELLEHQSDNSEPESAEFFLGPRRSLRLRDVLASSFGDVDKAALRMSTTGGLIMATDRTFNLLGEGNGLGLPAGSTFGQYIPLRDGSAAVSDVDEGRLIGLTHDDRARTNLGLVNVSASEIRVMTELFLADGTELGSFNTTLAPYEYRQITRVFERATSAPVTDGYIVVTTRTEGGRFLAQASVVDAITGDPVFIPATRMAFPAGQAPPATFIVAAAHVAGAAGTNWRTDLEIHNPNDVAIDYTVELLELNTDNSSPSVVTRALSAGASVRHEDALIELFGFDGAAALRIVPEGGRIVATSRTYNLLEEGNPYGLPAGASFGQFIPGADIGEAITPDGEGRMVHLAHDPSGAQGYRTNLVLVNGTSNRAPTVIDLYSADATPLGSFEVNLRPFEYKQINNVFERVTQDVVDDGYAVVRLDRDQGAVFSLASVVDNLTGDPVGMMATVVRSPSATGAFEAILGLMGVLGGVGLESPVEMPAVLGAIQDYGVEGIGAAAVDTMPPGSTTFQGGVITTDFGEETVVNGVAFSGLVTIDLQDLAIEPESVRGQIVETHDGYTINGRPALVDEAVIDLDFEVRDDESVVGTIGLSAGASAKSSEASLEGSVGFDSSICLYYPTSGEVTFTDPDGEVVTVTFGPECDGSFDVDVDAFWDWDYRFQSPVTDWAKAYVVEVSNAHVTSDVADYWIPDVGGTEFYGRDNPGDTPAGIITYHFPFSNPTMAARIRTDTATFNFAYSRGHNYLLASSDGVSWEVINEVTPPDNEGDPPRNGYYDGLLPPSVLGADELWIRVELYSYGPQAPAGATNTAQHARFWESGARDTFILEVACAGGSCTQ